MRSSVFQKIPLLWKFVVFYFIIFLVFLGGIFALVYYFEGNLDVGLWLKDGLIRSVLIVSLGVVLLATAIFYFEMNSVLKRLNDCLQEALFERKLTDLYEETYQQLFDHVMDNVSSFKPPDE